MLHDKITMTHHGNIIEVLYLYNHVQACNVTTFTKLCTNTKLIYSWKIYSCFQYPNCEMSYNTFVFSINWGFLFLLWITNTVILFYQKYNQMFMCLSKIHKWLQETSIFLPYAFTMTIILHVPVCIPLLSKEVNCKVNIWIIYYLSFLPVCSIYDIRSLKCL